MRVALPGLELLPGALRTISRDPKIRRSGVHLHGETLRGRTDRDLSVIQEVQGSFEVSGQGHHVAS